MGFLAEVGLDYLSLGRATATLSGGEAQRIRLATQIGSGLVGVAYILDEPSIGLHQRHNDKLLKALMRLRDLGNSLIVVEHDEDTMRAADCVVDIGPGGYWRVQAWLSGCAQTSEKDHQRGCKGCRNQRDYRFCISDHARRYRISSEGIQWEAPGDHRTYQKSVYAGSHDRTGRVYGASPGKI